ncbi:MAG: MFS transporter [Elusimicrobia bacterium CG1_02_56_21]|nr:MAG: MFS transporter [Elusimicrobia bacterium CG1_02_56_21]
MTKLTERLSLKKNLLVLLSAAVLIELGEKMGERFLPLYIMALGGSSLAIGFLNAADNFLGAVYSFPGGYLSDRIGYKKSLILFNLAAVAGYLIVILFPSWQAALAGSILFIAWSSVSLPAVMSAISKLLPFHKRTMGVSMHSISRRFPMALGPLLGGLCVQHWGEKDGVRIAFIFALGLSVAALFMQHYFLEHVAEPPAGKMEKNPLRVLSATGAKLKHLLVSDILIRYCEQIPYAFVVIWCIKGVGISPVQFGVLTTIEMCSAVLIYIPVAWLVEKTKTKKPYIAITFGFFSFFPLVLMYSQSFYALVFAFIIRGFKEFGEPARKALILDLAPKANKALTYGAYYFVRDIVVAAAALGGGLLWSVSPQLNLVAAFVFGLAGTAYFLAYCRE